MKTLIDTNVIVDALTSREPWKESAEIPAQYRTGKTGDGETVLPYGDTGSDKG